MISERTLKQWRKEALKDDLLDRIELNKRILRMTLELLDLHLIKK